ncbi:MAG: exodeoxyribonuclease III [Bacteroidales bacterium]|jgi:exodeoxyribonuclease-3|nr:exodeoxyribonuclease III [Bacteroidales bacterium]
MKIISYNVNGIRAAVKKGFISWLQQESPDVICIQETKAQEDQMPTEELNAIGYNCYYFSAKKKGYSGVAIFSKQKPDNVVYGMGIEKYDNEGRMIRADFGDKSIISVYHPSGTSGEERQAFKMQWLEDFQKFIEELSKTRSKLIICGDYNICHQEIDIFDPKGNKNNSGFLPEERQWIDSFIKSGYIDSFRYIYPQKKDMYSWWSYRFNARKNNRGWRIDYSMVTDNMKENIKDASILMDVFHSDHCPISLTINL